MVSPLFIHVRTGSKLLNLSELQVCELLQITTPLFLGVVAMPHEVGAAAGRVKAVAFTE